MASSTKTAKKKNKTMTKPGVQQIHPYKKVNKETKHTYNITPKLQRDGCAYWDLC